MADDPNINQKFFVTVNKIKRGEPIPEKKKVPENKPQPKSPDSRVGEWINRARNKR